MDCSHACALLEPYLDGELDAAEGRALEAHLDTCPGCADALSRLDALRRKLRDPALRHAAPAALRARLRGVADATSADARTDAAHAAATPARRHAPAWWQLAAACLLGVAVGGVAFHARPGADATTAQAQLSRDLLASHWRALAASSPVDVASSDHHTVKPWFAGKLAEAPPVADFATQGFRLVGGRLDYVGGARVAVLVYAHGAHVIDVFLLPDADADSGADAITPTVARGYALDPVTIAGQRAVIASDMERVERMRLAALLAGEH